MADGGCAGRLAATACALLLVAGCAVAPRPPAEHPMQWLSGEGPRYPDEAKSKGIEGIVVVEYAVDSSGRVRDPRVVRASPQGVFEEAALAAVGTWRYRPYQEDGQAVRLDGVRSTVRFRLGEAPWRRPND